MAAEKPTWEQIERDRDKPVKLPLDPEDALRGLLETPAKPDASRKRGDRFVSRQGDSVPVKPGENPSRPERR